MGRAPLPILNPETNEPLYELEKIIDWRHTSRGGNEFWVKWRGYGPKDNQWMKESEIPPGFKDAAGEIMAQLVHVKHEQKLVRSKLYQDDEDFSVDLEGGPIGVGDEDIQPNANAGQAEDDDEDLLDINDPFSKKVKERERHVQLKMACIDNQCMICGWPFRWAGGDKTHLGKSLYTIEQLYVSLTNFSYSRLFSDFQKSHILHKHSRSILQEQIGRVYKLKTSESIWEFLNLYIKDSKLIPKHNDDASNTQEIRTQQTWAVRNTSLLIENITSQVAYTLDSAFATFTSLTEDVDDIGNMKDLTAKSCKEWLLQQLRALSTNDKLRRLVAHYDGLTHAACEDCNRTQTMDYQWETAILGLIGIRKAHVPPTKMNTSGRQQLSDLTATIAMIYIVRAVTLKLQTRS